LGEGLFCFTWKKRKNGAALLEKRQGWTEIP
jgi:hypothetical protein